MTETEMFLYGYSDAKKRVLELELQIEELEDKRDAIYDKLLTPLLKEHVQGGPMFDPVVGAVEQLVDVYVERIRRVAGDLREASEKLAVIEALVNQAALTEIERRYVRLRYLDGLPAWRVSQHIGYCDRQGTRIKDRVIEKMSDHVRLFLVS